MVAVSLVDEQRQWFKASIGLGVCETHREVSFCAHIVEKPKVMVVEDAMLDDRFYDNPLVTEEPFIRFYAGAPLRPVGDEVLGTLCVMHTRPRSFSDDEQQLLKLLATGGTADQLHVAAQRKVTNPCECAQTRYRNGLSGTLVVELLGNENVTGAYSLRLWYTTDHGQHDDRT